MAEGGDYFVIAHQRGRVMTFGPFATKEGARREAAKLHSKMHGWGLRIVKRKP